MRQIKFAFLPPFSEKQGKGVRFPLFSPFFFSTIKKNLIALDFSLADVPTTDGSVDFVPFSFSTA